MALTLSVGFVVDDAIVMLENIVRHMEMGKTRMQASLDGSKEISFTIVSMTLSLAAVFIPVLFMGGIVGRLMHEFAVTIAAAILVSGLVSLTLTPMLCSRFLQAAARRAVTAASTTSIESMFEASLRWYGWTLRSDDPLQGPTMVVSALLLVGTVYLFGVDSQGLHPERRHRAAERPDRSDSGHRLRVHGRARQADHGHPVEGPERRRRSPPNVGGPARGSTSI